MKIKFVEKEPPTTWNLANCARVWLLFQCESERWTIRAGARRASGGWANFGKRKTLMFNGYGDQVASLYNGMDLRKNY